MDGTELALIWSSVTIGLLIILCYILVLSLRSTLKRNEYLTSLVAVGKAHGGKGTDAARAHIAAIKELKKTADLKSAGVTTPPGKTPERFRVRQTTP
jgi:hypothetical protein